MANDQAYNLPNFKSILSYYSTLVKNAIFESVEGLHAETPFMPKSWTYTTTDDITGQTTEVVIGNPGYNYAMELLGLFKTTSDNIRDALLTLFINYDDPKEMQQEDFNFNIINAYASASQSLQWYNKDTEEFESMPEYWFTRGCWYDMLPMCTKGDYIRAKHSNVLQAVNAIKKCRRYYEYEFTYQEPATDYTDNFGYSYQLNRRYTYSQWNSQYNRYATYSQYSNSRFFVLAFWNQYLQTLSDEVKSCLNPIWKFGQYSGKREQTASTAKLTYITQLASDSEISIQQSNTAVKTARQISSTSGTYDAKKAKISIIK